MGVGVALAVAHSQHFADGDVGDGVVGGLAQEHLALKTLDKAGAPGVADAHEDGVVVEAAAVGGGHELEVEAGGLGRLTRFDLLDDAPADLDIDASVALDRAGDLVAVATDVDVGDLLRFAVELAAEDDGAVGRHGHGDGVVADDSLVLAADVEAAGAEGLERVAEADVGDADGGNGLVGGLQGRREDGRDDVRVGAEAGGDAAEGLELGGGVELLEVADLLKGLHVAELHRGLLECGIGIRDQSMRLPPSTLSAWPVM